MTKDEALKMALEALEYHTAQTRPIIETMATINVIKEALAQPNAVYSAPTKLCGPNLVEILNSAGFYKKREWVGLTTDERDHFTYIDAKDKARFRKHSDYIEATLKEKNQ